MTRSAPADCIDHFLKQSLGPVPHEGITLPDRVFNPDYERAVLPRLYVPNLLTVIPAAA